MTKLVKHVPVRRGFDTVWFAPGDDLPEWAVSLVGDHALAPETRGDVEADSDEGLHAMPKAKPKAAPAKPKTIEAPDFTSAAPRRGRPGK